MLHKLESSMLMGILNLECEVWPPGIIEEVMLDVVTMEIIYLDLIVANSTWYKNVFPMSLWPSIKETPLALEFIQSSIVEYAISYSGFKVIGACKSSSLMFKANSSEISLFSMVFVFSSLKSMSGKS